MNEKQLLESLKRLEKVAEESGRVTRKVKESCAEMANALVDQIGYAGYDIDNYDPMRDGLYETTFFVSGERGKNGLRIICYTSNGTKKVHLVFFEELSEYQIGYPEYYSLMDADYITRERAIKFCKEINNGLFDKVANIIENDMEKIS